MQRIRLTNYYISSIFFNFIEIMKTDNIFITEKLVLAFSN